MPVPTVPKLAKLPFYIGNLLMLEAAFILIFQSRTPLEFWEILVCVLCVAIGTVLGVWPFVLEYRAAAKLAEAEGIAAAVAQLQSLEPLAAQITHATSQWQNAQAAADKTAAAAQTIAERIAAEVKDFNRFVQHANDTEKAALRLEVDKLHRAEGDWLQVAVRMLDHTFAFHRGAEQSGSPALVENVSRFQNACRDAARRVGLAPFAAAADEPFDATRHQLADGVVAPGTDAVVGETLAAGYTYQGQLIRPAVVRLRNGKLNSDSAPAATAPELASGQGDLPLDSSAPALLNPR